MKTKTKVCSDEALGNFLLDCFKVKVEAKKIAKEINKMCEKLCTWCKCVLSDDEAREGICCDKCYQSLYREDETKNPDEGR